MTSTTSKGGQAYIQTLSTYNFSSNATDQGSEATNDIAFWYPTFSGTAASYFALGQYANQVQSYGPPPSPALPGPMIIYQGVNDSSNPLFVAPIGINLAWSAGSVYYYNVQAPDGYIAITGYCSDSIIISVSGLPSTFMCIRKDQCEQITTADLIWNDHGSSNSNINLDVFLLPNSGIAYGYASPVNNGHHPSSVKTYDVKASIFQELK